MSLHGNHMMEGPSFGGKMGLLALVLVLLLTGCQSSGKQVVRPVANGDRAAVASLPEEAADGWAVETAAMDPAAVEEEIFEARIDQGRFDPQFVQTRLKIYTEKGDKWQALEEKMRTLGLGHEQERHWRQCAGLLAELVDGYGAVLDRQGDALAVIRRDIAFAESNCEEMFAVHSARVPELLARFQQEAAAQVEVVIDYYAERHDHENVVAAYENAEQFNGRKLEDKRLQEIYGRALLRTGRLEKAASVFSGIVAASGPYERWPLRLQVGELLIASGEYEKARAEYLHLAEILDVWEEINKSVTAKLALLFAAENHARELSLYSQTLQAFLTFDGKAVPAPFESAVAELRDNYPGGIHTVAAGALYQQVEDQVRQHTAVQLTQVEQLVDSKEFKPALDLLRDLRQSRLPVDCLERVNNTMAMVTAQREEYAAVQREKTRQDLADQWQEGLNLLDMQLYDDSITIFMGMLGTEYDSRAAAEIDKASLLAAKALRKKAAAVFVRAGQTTDTATRAALLKESRTHLQMILERYPHVEIADKVAVNLQVVEEQLVALGEL